MLENVLNFVSGILASGLLMPVLVTLILTVALANSFKIIPENQRFAIFILGRFKDYAGPGLIFWQPFVFTGVKITVGPVGTKLNDEFVRFGGVDLPAEGIQHIRDGDPVRISRFDGPRPVFEQSHERPQQLCPNCGHHFQSF